MIKLCNAVTKLVTPPLNTANNRVFKTTGWLHFLRNNKLNSDIWFTSQWVYWVYSTNQKQTHNPHNMGKQEFFGIKMLFTRNTKTDMEFEIIVVFHQCFQKANFAFTVWFRFNGLFLQRSDSIGNINVSSLSLCLLYRRVAAGILCSEGRRG